MVNVLPHGRSYGLIEQFLRWKPEIDRVTGEQILLSIPGDNEQSGDIYKMLRTPDLIRRDAEDAQRYRQRLRKQESTPAAELHVNIDIVNKAAVRLNVDLDSLPCIAWSTFPDLSPTLLLPIKPSWCESERASRRFLESFVDWLRKGQCADLFDRRVTVGQAREGLIPLITALSRRIDAAVAERERSKKPKRRRSKQIVAIRLERITEMPATKTRCARLIVTQNQKPQPYFIGIRQLFFLTAFVEQGQSRLINGTRYRALSQNDLSMRLMKWHKAGIRTLAADAYRNPHLRIQRDWPQFLDQMRAVPGLEDTFGKPHRDPDDEQVYYLFKCENIRLVNAFDEQELERLSVRFADLDHRQ